MRPKIPLSKIVKTPNEAVSRRLRPYVAVPSQISNPKLAKRFNLELRRQAITSVDDIQEKEGMSLKNKFFVLDHTAEVLENYRRVKENEIFQRILHEDRDKRAFLRRESRKNEHLIDNYQQRFLDYQYDQGGNSTK